MKENKKTLAVIAILCLIIIGIIVALLIKNLDKDKYIINVNYKELVEKINNKEDFVLYIGKNGCSACEEFNPKFTNIVNKYKVKVYYLDLSTYSDEELKYVTNNISFTGTPTVVFMIKGKDSLNSDTKIVGNISESRIITKLKNRGYIK